MAMLRARAAPTSRRAAQLDWSLIESPEDPVVGAAVAWLRTRGCA